MTHNKIYRIVLHLSLTLLGTSFLCWLFEWIGFPPIIGFSNGTLNDFIAILIYNSVYMGFVYLGIIIIYDSIKIKLSRYRYLISLSLFIIISLFFKWGLEQDRFISGVAIAGLWSVLFAFSYDLFSPNRKKST